MAYLAILLLSRRLIIPTIICLKRMKSGGILTICNQTLLFSFALSFLHSGALQYILHLDANQYKIRLDLYQLEQLLLALLPHAVIQNQDHMKRVSNYVEVNASSLVLASIIHYHTQLHALIAIASSVEILGTKLQNAAYAWSGNPSNSPFLPNLPQVILPHFCCLILHCLLITISQKSETLKNPFKQENKCEIRLGLKFR